jgi:hypothetical protein
MPRWVIYAFGVLVVLLIIVVWVTHFHTTVH